MKIRIYPDPVLRIKSKEVKEIDSTVKKIIKNMKRTMVKEEGIGLAANQVGITKRIIILDYFDKKVAMINPEIVVMDGQTEEGYEGCLSFPELSVLIERYVKVRIKYINENNEEVEETLTDIHARAFQHELDHLNGKLIIDYMEPHEQLDYNLKLAQGEKND